MFCSIAVVVSTAICSLRYSTGNFCPWYFDPAICRLRRSTRKFYHGDFIQVFVDFVVPLVGGGGGGGGSHREFWDDFPRICRLCCGFHWDCFLLVGNSGRFFQEFASFVVTLVIFSHGGNSGHFQKSQQRQGQINEKGDQRKKHHTVDGIPSTGPE